jgi:hypothetical protein
MFGPVEVIGAEQNANAPEPQRALGNLNYNERASFYAGLNRESKFARTEQKRADSADKAHRTQLSQRRTPDDRAIRPRAVLERAGLVAHYHNHRARMADLYELEMLNDRVQGNRTDTQKKARGFLDALTLTGSLRRKISRLRKKEENFLVFLRQESRILGVQLGYLYDDALAHRGTLQEAGFRERLDPKTYQLPAGLRQPAPSYEGASHPPSFHSTQEAENGASTSRPALARRELLGRSEVRNSNLKPWNWSWSLRG